MDEDDALLSISKINHIFHKMCDVDNITLYIMPPNEAILRYKILLSACFYARVNEKGRCEATRKRIS